MKTEIKTLAEGRFEIGADIVRDGQRIYRVPSATYWDDDVVRVIDRDGEAVVQSECRAYSGNRSSPTGEWTDEQVIGPVEGLEVIYDHARGCGCEECY